MIAAEWKILYTLEWRCRATSDGGIDASEEKERRLVDISADDVVLDGDVPVGIRYADHLFLFDDSATHEFWREQYVKYVGGWGEVYEVHGYTLVRAGE